MTNARVQIDHELCSGTGSCARIYPELFELREDLKAHVRVEGTATLDQERLATAVQSCPWSAIAFSEPVPS